MRITLLAAMMMAGLPMPAHVNAAETMPHPATTAGGGAIFPDNVEIELRIDCNAIFTRELAGRVAPTAKREYIFLFPADVSTAKGAIIPFIQTDSTGRTFFLRSVVEQVDRKAKDVFRIVLVTSYDVWIELSSRKPLGLDNIGFRSSYTDPDTPGVVERATCQGRAWPLAPVPPPAR